MSKVPKDFEVKVLKPGQPAKDRATCGHCGRSWDDAIATSFTPAPSARCPFEYFHEYPEEKPVKAKSAPLKVLSDLAAVAGEAYALQQAGLVVPHKVWLALGEQLKAAMALLKA